MLMLPSPFIPLTPPTLWTCGHSTLFHPASHWCLQSPPISFLITFKLPLNSKFCFIFFYSPHFIFTSLKFQTGFLQFRLYLLFYSFPSGSVVKNPISQEDQVWSWWGNPCEANSNPPVFCPATSWTESGGLESMELQESVRYMNECHTHIDYSNSTQRRLKVSEWKTEWSRGER